MEEGILSPLHKLNSIAKDGEAFAWGIQERCLALQALGARLAHAVATVEGEGCHTHFLVSPRDCLQAVGHVLLKAPVPLKLIL